MGDRRFNAFTAISTMAVVVCLGLTGTGAASASNPAPAASARAVCGVVIFKKNPHGSGGVIGASGVSCKRARSLMAQCGRRGVKPAHWKVTFKPSQAKLTLTRGKARISVVYGGHPPGARRCAR